MSVAGGFGFGPFWLDVRARRLFRNGEPVDLQPRHFDLLYALVSRPGEVLTKDQLIQAVWQDVAVSDSSLVKIAAHLRDVLDPTDANRYIATVTRRGYRFVPPVSREAATTALDLDDVLAPHRALVDGRAALETLGRDEVARARPVFEQLVLHDPTNPTAHVGLANACIMQFEATRAEAAPDFDALARAVTHAYDACRLDAASAEAWATLGFVLGRTGDQVKALAALRHAVSLDPDNWRHALRLSYGSWGEERRRAARQTLAELPGCPMAHWLIASVYVARNALDRAERELDAGLAATAGESGRASRFSAVALHWLRGLLCLARGAEAEALEAFERELALEACGHLYARECSANTWYSIGAVRLRRGETNAARQAFEQAIVRVPAHSRAHSGLALSRSRRNGDAMLAIDTRDMEGALARAVLLVATHDVAGAVEAVAAALADAPAGNAGWFVPIEPLLAVGRASSVWAPVLSALRTRAS
jgi:DNA-binding winged helix-turn-helix (wHTH) protein/cytochrome c-type biogenesis protein CcmH/NrfG